MGGGGEGRRPVCSERCRYFITWGSWPSGKDLVHVGPVPDPEPPTREPVVVRPSGMVFYGGECAWCGAGFTRAAPRGSGVPETCGDACRKRLAKSRRDSRFAVPIKMRLSVYERDGFICQLCFDPVDVALPANDVWSATLDHIVCQSWTAEPDHSAANLRLAHRWCNSKRGNRA